MLRLQVLNPLLNFRIMNILVTGGAGQLGREVQNAVKGSTNHYIFTDASDLDICNRSVVEEFCIQNRVQIILNCAAYTQVDAAEKDIQLADQINHQAVAGLAQVAKILDITFFHISTDYVFGGRKNEPFHEDEPTEPLGVYGSTKRMGEEAIMRSGCSYLIFRTAWLYSWQGNNFVQTMLKLTASKPELTVVFDQVGSPTNAADLAACLVHIIDSKKYMNNDGIYHFTNEGVCSWYDFAWQINAMSGHSCRVKPCYSSQFPSAVRRPSYSVLDKTKIKSTFQIEIPYWTESLEKCIQKINDEKL